MYKGPTLAELTKRNDPSALHSRLAELAARPGTRKAIPLKYLTGDLAKYVKPRQQAIFAGQPVVPGSAMTNAELGREARAATEVQYGAPLRSLGNQQRATGDYYDAYVRDLRASQQTTVSQAQQTAQAIAALGSSGQQAAQPQDAASLKQAQDDARSRGATLDPNLAIQAGQASQVNKNISDAAAGTAALLGQSQANYLGALANAAGAQKLAALNKNASDLVGTQREAGAYKTQYVSKRRSEESQNAATMAVASGKQVGEDANFSKTTGYTIDQWNQLTPGEKLAALRKVTGATHPPKPPTPPKGPSTIAKPPSNFPGSEADWNRHSFDYRSQWLKNNPTSRPAAGGKDAFGNTTKDRSRHDSQYKKALRIGKVVGGDDPQSILLALTQKFPTVDDAILAGAAQTVALGRVGPKTAQGLRELGITGYHTRRVVKRPKPGSGAPANP